MPQVAQCPYPRADRPHTLSGARSNADWWPNQLKLGILHQHSSKSDPMGAGFNYAEAFKSLDVVQSLYAS